MLATMIQKKTSKSSPISKNNNSWISKNLLITKMQFSSAKTPINCDNTDFLLKVIKNDIKILPIRIAEIFGNCGNKPLSGENTSEFAKRYSRTRTPSVIGTFKKVDVEILSLLFRII